ncbi:MAG: CehA/McbA family metallohydrolase [Oscillospiraceae bacterium]
MKQFVMSKPEIVSFVGNVVTLKICSEIDLQDSPIKWSNSDPKTVRIKSCVAEKEGFHDGVLLTFLQEGKATITAEFDGQKADCSVTVHPMKHTDSEAKMNYYRGDLHSHTAFSDGVGTPEIAFRRVCQEGNLDFFTVSDHGVFYTPYRAFETIRAAEEFVTPTFFPIAAQEADVYFEIEDDYGLMVQQGGELLTFQAEGWAEVKSWDDFFACIGENPCLMLGIPHPSDVGGKTSTIWNGYNLPFLTEPRAKKYLRFVEILNSPTFEAYNLLHERIWSQALDFGYRVCPTAGSDSHSWNWGEGAIWSRTVIMAPELSGEALLDSMKSNRVYVTESGNVKLQFQVNGVHMGGTIPASDFYLADFSFDVFKPANENERIVKAELFSDYGDVVDSIDLNRIRGNYTLSSRNRSSRYFYLRLTDAAGDRTWSAPIWTDNEPDKPLPPMLGKKIPIHECTVVSAIDGDHREKIMNGNPNDGWLSKTPHAEIIIDTGKVRNICGMGYYHHYVEVKNCTHVAQLLARYEIEVSVDGITYTPVAHGNRRSYGGEQITHIPPCQARYLKFIALSSVGADRGIPKYKDVPVAIGELSVYEE